MPDFRSRRRMNPPEAILITPLVANLSLAYLRTGKSGHGSAWREEGGEEWKQLQESNILGQWPGWVGVMLFVQF